jgi:hypothetical protein
VEKQHKKAEAEAKEVDRVYKVYNVKTQGFVFHNLITLALASKLRPAHAGQITRAQRANYATEGSKYFTIFNILISRVVNN